jgi:hypothetical protein
MGRVREPCKRHGSISSKKVDIDGKRSRLLIGSVLEEEACRSSAVSTRLFFDSTNSSEPVFLFKEVAEASAARMSTPSSSVEILSRRCSTKETVLTNISSLNSLSSPTLLGGSSEGLEVSFPNSAGTRYFNLARASLILVLDET